MDPFQILGLQPGAKNKDIVQAAAQALRQRQFSGHEIARAQKELLNPIKREAYAFLHLLEIEESSQPTQSFQRVHPDTQDVLMSLERLTCFDQDQT